MARYFPQWFDDVSVGDVVEGVDKLSKSVNNSNAM